METFSGLRRLKHLGVRIITCGWQRGGSTYRLTTIAQTCRQEWCQILRVFMLESDFRWVWVPFKVSCKMPKASSFELGKTTQAGTWKTKGKAKGKHAHWNLRRSRHVFGSRSKREHPVRNARNWQKINFFITGDKFRTFLDMPSFAPSWFFDTSGFVELLWNLNGWIVFRRSRYEKRAGSGSLSVTLTSEESGSASNSSTLDLFSLSLFHRYDRSHFVDTLEISGNCYAIDRVSKHRGPVMSHAIFSIVDRWLSTHD